MGKSQALSKNTKVEKFILLGIFSVLFVYFLLQQPLYSPDTFSYLRADISRFPGYVLFLRGLQFIFNASFDLVAVGIQLIFGFAAITVIFKKCTKIFNLRSWPRILLLGLLILPYFYPLYIANNLTSEGISYPLYLLLMTFAFDFIFNDEKNKILHIAIVFLALALTRGQFIIVAPIIAFVFALKLKKQVFTKVNIGLIAFLLLLPVLSGVLDSTYRKAVHGYFIKTPYSYVNAITLPLFVSEKENVELMPSEDTKKIFEMSYARIDSLNLLSSKVNGSYKVKYKQFHEYFPKICNQNIHDQGKAYYYAKDPTPHMGSILTEAASKTMFPILLKANFKEWLSIYYTSIVHGFKSVFVLFFILTLAIISLWKAIKKFNMKNGFILFGCLLIISNAMIVAVASHSIIRYLFYNYFIGLLIIVILLKKIISKYES